GPYFLDAVRSGAKGLAVLTNFVDSITITETSASGKSVTVYTNSPGLMTVINGVTYNGSMVNSEWIIGLLSRPKYVTNDPSRVEIPYVVDQNVITNRIDAHVRAMSGAAINQGTLSRDLSFSYSI